MLSNAPPDHVIPVLHKRTWVLAGTCNLTTESREVLLKWIHVNKKFLTTLKWTIWLFFSVKIAHWFLSIHSIFIFGNSCLVRKASHLPSEEIQLRYTDDIQQSRNVIESNVGSERSNRLWSSGPAQRVYADSEMSFFNRKIYSMAPFEEVKRFLFIHSKRTLLLPVMFVEIQCSF